MSKDLGMSLLLDFYGDVLTEPQREAMDLFYNGDLSLSEIAEDAGITRQCVRDRIVKGEKILTELESKLGLAKRFGSVEKDVSFIIGRLRGIQDSCGIDLSDVIGAAEDIKNRFV